jgi:hypothetical protein
MRLIRLKLAILAIRAAGRLTAAAAWLAPEIVDEGEQK